MSKIFAKIFPLFDHLYIFQNFEYESKDFLSWFFKHPLKRNLQRKHNLDWTPKSVLLALISLILGLISIYIFPPLVFAVLLLSPFYLMVSQLILFPIEYYQKQKTIRAARLKINELKDLKIIAIVGSYAKTSTKNMLYTLLWKDFKVVKTPKSYNTPISIARTILSDLKEGTEVFIVEMDAYHPGNIKNLCDLAGPNMGVITSIAKQHLQRFGSMERLAKAQFELAESLPKEGVLFLNSEDEWINKLASNYSNKKIFYGKEGDYQANSVSQNSSGISFELKGASQSVKVNLPILGVHNVINFLAAASMANNLGMSLKDIALRADKILPTPHRLEIKKQGALTIIDNTYNTNPTSSQASLQLLRDIPGSQKILVTPGLVELGKEHSKQNQEFAKSAAKVADEIVIVGENAKQDLLRGLEEAKYPQSKTHLVATTQQAFTHLTNLTHGGDIVLMENDLPDQYF